jgi:hypothetical protein
VTELTRTEADGLVDVRLVMGLVFDREGRDPTELAAPPGRVATLPDGFLYAFERAAYGLVRKSDDRRGDFVWERRVANGRIESRLFDRTGRLIRHDVDHGSSLIEWVFPPEIADWIAAEVSPIGLDPTRN